MNDNEKITISQRSFNDFEVIVPKIGLDRFTQIVSEKTQTVRSLSRWDLSSVMRVQENFAHDEQVELSLCYLSETIREQMMTAYQKHPGLKPGTIVEMAILIAELETLSSKDRSRK